MVERIRIIRNPLKLMSKQEVADHLGVAPQTVMRWVREGSFPMPVEITTQTIRWRQIDVLDWIGEKQRESREAADVA